VITPEKVLVAAPDTAFRRSLEFALESAGFGTSGHLRVTGAFASEEASQAACAVIDDHAIDNWKLAPDQFRQFAKPVILLTGRFHAAPALPLVTLVIKPFLGEPLIEAVRNAIAGTH
jgi:FixJ family two-component response regulator